MGGMNSNYRVIRVLIVAAVWIIAQAVPAFAEKITLACSLGAPGPTYYFTFNLAAKTVKDEMTGEVHPLGVTADELRWQGTVTVIYVYNRNTAQLKTYADLVPCHLAPRGPV
jgi:hypothetical protein